jgi:pyruvate formate lyase activating enzyme
MTNKTIHPTKYWHQIDSQHIQCDVCPRACKLKNGQQGLCFVRACVDDQIVLTSYGRSSGFAVDPIEKKPLNHFYPGSSVFSFGTAGCNLACKFCQNWDMSKSRQMDTLAATASPQEIAISAQHQHCQSVAYTYNDPAVFLEYAIDTAIACHEKNIQSVAVTAGYFNPEPRHDFFQHMDAANVDLKAFTDRFYWKITGGHLAPVLETLKYIKHETKTWLEITTLLIPGENDSPAETNEMTEWIAEHLGPDTPLHFTAFHPAWKIQDITRTPDKTLKTARQIAINNGLNYVYTGNIHDIEGGTTFCPRCQKPLIIRDWHHVIQIQINDAGQCPHCKTDIAGKFS